MSDFMESVVRTALTNAKISFVEEEDDRAKGLDFYLIDYDLHIEVKQFHSDRIGGQMARVPNVIAIQGKGAALFFAGLVQHLALQERQP